jgi:hypothetical protein
MPMVELHFPVLGPSLPVDHGYALYSALCRVLPAMHARAIRICFLGPLGANTTPMERSTWK